MPKKTAQTILWEVVEMLRSIEEYELADKVRERLEEIS